MRPAEVSPHHEAGLVVRQAASSSREMPHATVKMERPNPSSTAPLLPRLVPIAPAATPPTPSTRPAAIEDVPHMPYTCVTCARRKVKCDKTGPPCGTCRKARQECHYQEPAPRKRKRKPVDDLHDRLEKYEHLLKENGILPKDFDSLLEKPASIDIAPSDQRPPTPPSQKRGGHDESGDGGTLLKGNGRTRYIESNIWRNFGEDLHPDSDEEDGDYGDHDSAPASAEPLDPVSAALFGPTTPGQNLIDLHPTYDVAMKLWKIYTQNVDPVIKICHVPTTLEMIQRAAVNPSAATKVTECLIFAIYHFAVASLAAKECETHFGCAKAGMLRRYQSATQQALVACHFLRTTELAVLQAYMLFLLAVRNEYDPHTFWILTGIAVRIAQRMGLHRDGEALGLNPFDVQMRRRVFWQLLPLDGLSGQISGTGIAISSDSWDTKQPLNINDTDIWPGMESTPQEIKGATDMIFCLARSEIGRFHQKIKPASGNWSRIWAAKDTPAIHDMLQELENTMEEKYIRYCDISNPVHCLTMGMARGSVTVARLRIRLPRAMAEDATITDREELYGLAMKVLDHSIATYMNNALNRYNWHLKAFFQWDPLIWLLREARRDDCVVDRGVMWSKVEQVFTSHPDMMNSKRAIDIAMARLTLRSWDDIQSKNTVRMPDPGYIAELRAAFGRREASRQTTETLKRPINPFNPPLDTSFDVQVSPEYYSGTTSWGYGNYSLMENANLDVDVDWMFWDQLTRDAQAFTTS